MTTSSSSWSSSSSVAISFEFLLIFALIASCDYSECLASPDQNGIMIWFYGEREWWGAESANHNQIDFIKNDDVMKYFGCMHNFRSNTHFEVAVWLIFWCLFVTMRSRRVLRTHRKNDMCNKWDAVIIFMMNGSVVFHISCHIERMEHLHKREKTACAMNYE